MKILLAILFGLVEGVSEWLCISAQGHLILLNALLRFEVETAFYDLFETVIRLSALLAVAFSAYKALWPWKKTEEGKMVCERKTLSLWLYVLLSGLPVILLLPLSSRADFFRKPLPTALVLVLFGALMLMAGKRGNRKRATVRALSALGSKNALLIGCFTLLSLLPGVSVYDAAILGGLVLGLTRGVTLDYALLFAIPARIGQGAWKIAHGTVALTGEGAVLLLFGGCAAFAVSLFAVYCLKNYIRRHDFRIFACYRILLGILMIFYFGVLTQ